MRTKKEIMSNLPTKLKEQEEYAGWDHVEVRVRVGMLEALLDIRDILDRELTQHNQEKPLNIVPKENN